ncbi:MAG: hypothetical protein IKX16_02400 [Clostridia bacterium]|nr:hypothetical protein [Clostridia bacterium]
MTIDDLLSFDQRRTAEAVDALVAQSVPLRADPAKAEVFYREALKKYPNNEVLLNCLLMVIPDDRSREKIEIGEHLLDCTVDDEIKLDVLRLLALTCHHTGEHAMAAYYLSKLPELYFLKTEIAAFLKSGEGRMEEIRKTEDICIRTMATMLALRISEENTVQGKAAYRDFADRLLKLFRELDGQEEHADQLETMLKDGSILEFCQ